MIGRKRQDSIEIRSAATAPEETGGTHHKGFRRRHRGQRSANPNRPESCQHSRLRHMQTTSRRKHLPVRRLARTRRSDGRGAMLYLQRDGPLFEKLSQRNKVASSPKGNAPLGSSWSLSIVPTTGQRHMLRALATALQFQLIQCFSSLHYPVCIEDVSLCNTIRSIRFTYPGTRPGYWEAQSSSRLASQA